MKTPTNRKDKTMKNSKEESSVIVRPRTAEVIPPGPGEFPLIQSDQAMQNIIRLIDSNMAGQKMSVMQFPKIQAPAAGSDLFVVDGSSNRSKEPEMMGVIVGFRQARQYWKDPYGTTGGKKPPDCSSEDGLVGNLKPNINWGPVKPTGNCYTCPLAAFGSGRNDAPACQDRRWLLVLLPGQQLPHFFNLPPTSVPNFMQYVYNLTSEGLDYWSVVTRIVTESTKSRGQVDYSKVRFWKLRMLKAEEAARVQPYQQRMVGFLKPLTVEATLASDGEQAPF